MPDYAVYGVHFYGTAVYGRPPLFDFFLEYFTAKPENYDRIKVEWQHPTGAWDRLRLVRNNYGFPTTDLDGQLLLDVVAGSDPGTYEDTNVTELRFHYYSMFLRQTATGDWVRAGNAICLMPKNYGSSTRLYELTPQIYRDSDTIFVSSYTGVGMLESFLESVGYQVDLIRSEIESLLWTAAPDKMSGGLLPILADQLGWPYEAELGMALARRQLLNAVYLYKMKGTRLGIEGAVSVLTGWAPLLVIESENLLGLEQASFATTLTGWYDAASPANGTFARSTAQAAEGVASLAVTKTSTLGTLSVRTANGVTPGALNVQPATMFPVVGSRSYSARVALRAGTTGRSANVTIHWYTADGTYISSSTSSPVTDSSANFTTVASVTATSPLTARGASVVVSWDAVPATEVHYLDAVRFGAGTFTSYVTPPGTKSLLVYLLADRVNLVLNPSFETGLTGWTATNAAIAQNGAGGYAGTNQLRTAASAAGDVTVKSAKMAVTAGSIYTASMHSQALSTNYRQVSMTIIWYNASNVEISRATGALITELAGTWVRPWVTAEAPALAVNAEIMVTIKSGLNGENHNLDAALFEQGELGTYFDAAVGSPIADYLWEGTAHAARSHYYGRRSIKNSRLISRLPDFLPAGMTLTTVFAQV